MQVVAITNPEAMVLVAIIAGFPATIGAIAAIRGRRGTKRLERTVDVGNERSLAEYVHDMAGTVEVTQGQLRTTTVAVGELKEAVLETRETVVETRERLEDTRDQVVETGKKLDDHLAEVREGAGLLSDQVREQMAKEAEAPHRRQDK